MLICPACGKEMAILEMEEVEIDYCFQCGAIWLDSGELSAVAGSATISEDLLQSADEFLLKERNFKCPICRTKMEKIKDCRDESCVVLDRCKKRHGLFFENGELRLLLEKYSAAKESRVVGLLRNIFVNREDGE